MIITLFCHIVYKEENNFVSFLANKKGIGKHEILPPSFTRLYLCLAPKHRRVQVFGATNIVTQKREPTIS